MPSSVLWARGGDREAANEADKRGGGLTADVHTAMGAMGCSARHEMDSKDRQQEGEDSVGYRERAQAAARLVSRVRGERQIALCHRPRLGPRTPAGTATQQPAWLAAQKQGPLLLPVD